MKNALLDVMMGLISLLCIASLVGLFVLPLVLEYWQEMRK